MPIERPAAVHPLSRYVSTADAIALLFRPHVEVVLHDTRSSKIHYIANPFSKRRVGDSSLSDESMLDDLEQPVIGPYRKTNVDGRHLRSVTAVLRDARGAQIGLLCINFDVSLLESISEQIGALAFLPGPLQPRAPLFRDWHDALEGAVAEHENACGMALAAFGKPELTALVARLERDGLLAARKAPTAVAQRLGISRATLYNYLKAAPAADAARSADAVG